MKKAVLAFDVGGTFIKAATLDQFGDTIAGTDYVYPARSCETKEVLLGHFYRLIVDQILRVGNPISLLGIGYSFPGPFHYEVGVSLIDNQGKFQSLFGVNLKDELQKMIQMQGLPGEHNHDQIPIVFENDCSLFALGEWAQNSGILNERSIYITIGTGTGSAFLVNGHLEKDGPGIPKNGWIYCMPCEGLTVDDWLSRRGLIRLAHTNGIEIEEPLDLYKLAQVSDSGAIAVFSMFGHLLGRTLHPIASAFDADAIVFGGQVSKSGHFFLQAAEQYLPGVVCALSKGTSESIYKGIFRYLQIKGLGASENGKA